MSKKSVLVVSSTPVFPCVQGNRQVIRQLLKWLKSRGYAVTFILQVNRLSRKDRLLYREVCDDIIVVGDLRNCLSLRKFISRVLRSCTARTLKLLRRRDSKKKGSICWLETVSIVDRLVSEKSIYAVIAQYYFMTPIFEPIRQSSILKIVQTHDAMSLVGSKIGILGADTQGREVSQAQEAAALSLADIVVAIEESEAVYFKKLLPETDVVTVGYAAEYGRKSTLTKGSSKDRSVLFIGSANPLNVRGIQWFIDHCWPNIIKLVPDACLRICGTVCQHIDASDRNIEIVGIVPQLDGEWARADVFVNPVDLGTGLKIKTIEALGHGKAIVAVSEAAAGIKLGNGGPLLVKDSSSEFSDAVVRLLLDIQLRESIESKAIHYTLQHLTLAKTYQNLETYFRIQSSN